MTLQFPSYSMITRWSNRLDIAINQPSPQLEVLLDSLACVETAAIRVQLREDLDS